jgi:hypothetical protein
MDGDLWANCAENPQGAPPRDPPAGNSLEQSKSMISGCVTVQGLFFREQYQQQSFGWYARDDSLQNNDDDESEHYPLLEHPINYEESTARINTGKNGIINQEIANAG